MSELHEAAERLHKLYGGASYRSVYRIEPTFCGHQQRDEREIVEAYLAEYDPTPLTADTFREVCGENGPISLGKDFYLFFNNEVVELCVGFWRLQLPHIITVGQLRQLLSLLTGPVRHGVRQ